MRRGTRSSGSTWRLVVTVAAVGVILLLSIALAVTALNLRHTQAVSDQRTTELATASALSHAQAQQLAADRALTEARTGALAAARTFAAELSTYDYRHLDSDFAAVLAHATGQFKTDFTKSSKDLEPSITQYQATSSGIVSAAGVTDATTTTATVIVFVDQTVTNSNSPQPRVDRNRLRLTLTHGNAGWLVERVEIL